MGIGVARKVRIVVGTTAEGPDGIEATTEEVATVWAEINTVSQSRNYDAGRESFATTYEFLIRYQPILETGLKAMIEYNNRLFKIVSIDRGDKIATVDKFRFDFNQHPQGRYIRIRAVAQDIS